MDSVAVRLGGLSGPVAGWLETAGTRYAFRYDPEYARAEQGFPLDPFCLPLSTRTYYSDGPVLDGRLAVFGSRVPHPQIMNAIEQVLARRMARVSMSPAPRPTESLGRLAWASAFASAPSLGGLYFDPVASGHTRKSEGVWADLRAGKRAIGKRSGNVLPALNAVNDGSGIIPECFDDVLSNMLPLPSSVPFLRLDRASTAGQRMPGVLRVVHDSRQAQPLTTRMAILDLAAHCGVYADQATLFTLGDLTAYWSFWVDETRVPAALHWQHRHGVPGHVLRLCRALGPRLNRGELYLRLAFSVLYSGTWAVCGMPELTPRFTPQGECVWDVAPLFSVQVPTLRHPCRKVRNHLRQTVVKMGQAIGLSEPVASEQVSRVMQGMRQWQAVLACHGLKGDARDRLRPAILSHNRTLVAMPGAGLPMLELADA